MKLRPSGISVLVTDDDASVRRLLRLFIESAGFDVCEAGDGREAVSVIGNRKVDVLLIDLIMPDQEGLETIRLLSRRLPGLKIIAMSGAFTPVYLHSAKLLGAHAALEKPITRESVLEAISAVTGAEIEGAEAASA
jgi:CheY-like chemotaxis protein